MLLDAIRKVKPALAHQDIVLEFKHFLIKDGYIYAQDGRLTAGAPIEQDLGHFLVPAAELEKVSLLFDQTKKTPKIKRTEQNLSITTDSHRVRIKTLDPQVFQVTDELPGEQFDVQPDFIQALRTVFPFISDNATQMWSMGAYIDGPRIYATNNVCLICATITDFHFKGMLPLWAIEFILAREQKLKRIGGDERCLRVEWEDGSWMRSQLIQGQFPEKGMEMLSTLQDAAFTLTPAWKQAYREAAMFSEGDVYIYKDKIHTKKDVMEFDSQADSPVPPEHEYSKWTTKFLTSVINASVAFDPQQYPKPCTFSGNGFRGLVVGKL